MKICLSTLCVAFLSCVVLADGEEGSSKFESFAFTWKGVPERTYYFSASAATIDDPVVIYRKVTVEGKQLRDLDIGPRIELQKMWLGKYVPHGRTFLTREQIWGCGPILGAEYDHCDAYVFRDESNGKEESYYIYIGGYATIE